MRITPLNLLRSVEATLSWRTNQEFGFLGASSFSNEFSKILVLKVDFSRVCHWLTSKRVFSVSLGVQKFLSLAWLGLGGCLGTDPTWLTFLHLSA